MSFLNVWSGIEPFADEVAHFLHLSSRQLSGGRVIVTKIRYKMRDLSVRDLVSEFHKGDRAGAVEIVARRNKCLGWQTVCACNSEIVVVESCPSKNSLYLGQWFQPSV